jgi:hypothetical protein
MMNSGVARPTEREIRIGQRLKARREERLFDALLSLRGVEMGKRFRFVNLLAVGGEGAIYTVIDGKDPEARLVGKVALQPWHMPIRITAKMLKERRGILAREAALIRDAGCPFLPEFRELALFQNPLLVSARGGAFAEPEPCLVMERLPGQDLDLWLCRVHRGSLDKKALRSTLDRLTVGLLQALTDLERRGFLFADLRPGNLRVVGRPLRRIRLLDAGGCVPLNGDGTRFPHVPSYLPPRVYRIAEEGEELVPSRAIAASMAGRTLYEVATGKAPQADTYVDMARLVRSPISPPVAEVIAALANEDFKSSAEALDALAQAAKKRRRRE